MPGDLRMRLGALLTVSALWLSAMAIPASAATTVRWVDNDSVPGDGPNKCDTAPYHTIQAAINNSNPYDTIYVCPGTYRQALHVDVKGLHIESISYRKAKLMPPVGGYAGLPDLVTIEARDVDFWNFRLLFAGGPYDPPEGPANNAGGVAPACEATDVAILVRAPNADVRGNFIRSTGNNTYSGECGYGYGIILTDSSQPGMVPDVSGPRVSSVSHNRVTDFKFGGILAEGETVEARIVRNAVRFVHKNDPASCVLVPVQGAQEGAPDFDCDFVVNSTPYGGTVESESLGIAAAGSLVEIRANTIYSTFDVALFGFGTDPSGAPSGPGPLVLIAGVAMVQNHPDSTVRNNTIDQTAFGIVVFSGLFVAADEPADNPAGVQVTGNRLQDNYGGMYLFGNNGVYYANRLRTGVFGIYVVVGQDNLFQGNDARYNFEIDCYDDTSGDGDHGTANWWTNEAEDRYNFGENNHPEGICIPTMFVP